MTKKILILGMSGLTGYKISKLAYEKFLVHGTYNQRQINFENIISYNANLTDQKRVKEIFLSVKPDIIINTTALHNVDYCEENPQQAEVVNAETIRTIFKNAKECNSQIIHISTDYVFDGTKSSPYNEEDKPMPLSIYGNSKLKGEKILSNTKHIIIRPSVVYGWTPLESAGTISSSGKPMNFALWILTKLNKKEPMKIVKDQYASATLADSLAESILKIAGTDKSGLYHISGLSCESRYDFAIKLAEKFGYDTSLISPVTSSSFVQKAKRPEYSCLDCTKAINDFGLKLLTTDEALDVMKSQVEKEAPHLLRCK